MLQYTKSLGGQHKHLRHLTHSSPSKETASFGEFEYSSLPRFSRNYQPGMARMKFMVMSCVWLPHIDKDIEQLVLSCFPCPSIKHAPAVVPLHLDLQNQGSRWLCRSDPRENISPFTTATISLIIIPTNFAYPPKPLNIVIAIINSHPLRYFPN